MMLGMRQSRLIWLIWGLFLARGVFFCAMLPLWEGWDEYAHFAFAQYVANGGALPRQDTPLSREIDESMRLAPLAYELRWIGPPYLTEAQWWALPENERLARRQALKELPPAYQFQPAAHAFTFYEAQQPPLYYWMLGIPLRLVRNWGLWPRALLLRLLSMALASLAIPLTWATVRGPLGIRAAALLAIAPGFLIDTCRIANDALAIDLVALLLYVLLRRKNWVFNGVLLGFAFLTKAYLLALIPVLLLRRGAWKSVAIAVAIGGWWYGRNVAMGMSFSGWLDHTSTAAALAAAIQINWLSAAHVVAKSFIWFGGWSFLTMKSWIYAVIELTAVVAVVRSWPHRRELQIPLLMTGFFLLAVAYGVMNDYAVHHVGNVPGWYLWSMAAPLSLIVARGLGKASIALLSAFALMDVYGTAALLAPYYAGLVERDKAAITQFPAALARMGIAPVLAILWLAATVAIPVCCILFERCCERSGRSLSAT